MFRILVLAVVAVVVVAKMDGHGMMKKCHRLGHPGVKHCCKEGYPSTEKKREDIKECMLIPHKPRSCDHNICVGEKLGFAGENGTIDLEAFEKFFSEEHANYPEYVESVKTNCINGDFENYGPLDACELVKMKICSHAQAYKECTEWDDNGPCAGIKNLVKECSEDTA